MKIKVNKNRPKLTSDEIGKMQNYSAFIKAYKAYKGVGIKMILEKLFLNKPLNISIGIGTTLLVSVLTYNQLAKNKAENERLNSSRDIVSEIPSMNIPYQTLEVKNFRRETNFYLPNGTEIKVPERAFVDSDGKPYRKNVELKYREFHNSYDILVSGIPMDIDSAGVQGQLETAGMFELLAFGKDGEPLSLAEGKSLEVKFGTYVEEEDYNYYFYDDNNGWEFKGKSNLEINQSKLDKQATLDKELNKPIEPKKYVEGNLVFDIRVNTRKYPELQSLKKIIWQYAGNEPFNMKENEWVFSQRWEQVDLISTKDGSNVYIMKLEKEGRKFTTLVTPVLAGKAFDEALEQYKKDMEKYGTRLERKQTEIDRLRFEADVFRTIRVTELGLWNCDAWIDIAKFQRKPARFILPKSGFKTKVFHLSQNFRTVFAYPAITTNGFVFNKDGDNLLVAIVGEDRFAYLTNSEIVEAMKMYSSEVEFDLTKNIIEATNLEDLKKQLTSK